MNKNYIAKVQKEYDQITEELSETLEPLKLKSLNRRHIQLARILEKNNELEQVEKQLSENRKLAEGEDEELKKLAYQHKTNNGGNAVENKTGIHELCRYLR